MYNEGSKTEPSQTMGGTLNNKAQQTTSLIRMDNTISKCSGQVCVGGESLNAFY